jgi:hypothetical protein
MRLKSERDSFGSREDDVVDKSGRIIHEHLFLSLPFEIKEYVLIEYAIFWIVCAFNKLFGILPGNWAVVSELR